MSNTNGLDYQRLAKLDLAHEAAGLLRDIMQTAPGFRIDPEAVTAGSTASVFAGLASQNGDNSPTLGL